MTQIERFEAEYIRCNSEISLLQVRIKNLEAKRDSARLSIDSEKRKNKMLEGIETITINQLLSNITSGKTFAEAGYTKQTRNNFSNAIRKMSGIVHIEQWTHESFYKRLPVELKRKDVFIVNIKRCGLSIQFVPCSGGLGVLSIME